MPLSHSDDERGPAVEDAEHLQLSEREGLALTGSVRTRDNLNSAGALPPSMCKAAEQHEAASHVEVEAATLARLKSTAEWAEFREGAGAFKRPCPCAPMAVAVNRAPPRHKVCAGRRCACARARQALPQTLRTEPKTPSAPQRAGWSAAMASRASTHGPSSLFFVPVFAARTLKCHRSIHGLPPAPGSGSAGCSAFASMPLSGAQRAERCVTETTRVRETHSRGTLIIMPWRL